MASAYPSGTVFAGFTLERLLGEGGMGAVYLARHPRIPRHDALKLLQPGLSHDPDFRRRFELEADMAGRLLHPNIVTVHDRGCDNDQLWIDMEYVEGVDCSQALSDGPMPVERALRIVTEVGNGLDYAHRVGLLHRDVKPANILLTRGDDPSEPERVVLTDFGVAKAVDANLQLTSTGSIVATLAYAAPEQINAGPLDRRVDVYALGCVLFELLTGSVPFPGGTAYEIMNQHLNKPPPRPSQVRRDLPRGLDAVIAMAMAKRPDDRFGSCRAFTTAAQTALSPAWTFGVNVPITSQPGPTARPPSAPPWAPWGPATAQIPGAGRLSQPQPSPAAPAYGPAPAGAPPRPRVDSPGSPPRDPRPPRPGPARHRTSAAVRRALSVAVLLVSALAAFVVPGDDREVPVRSALPLPVAAPLSDDQFVAALVVDGNLDLYVIDTATGATGDRLTVDPADDRGPVISLDRRTVIYQAGSAEEQSLRVVAVDGTGDRPLFPSPPTGCPSLGRPAWSKADPQLLAVVCLQGDRRLLRLLRLTGEIARTFDLGELSPYEPAFSPDASLVAFAAGAGVDPPGGALYSLRVDGSDELTRLTDSGDGIDRNPSWSPDGAELVFRRRLDDGSPDGNLELFRIFADGSGLQPVAPNPAQDYGPVWSPDGSLIAFLSRRPADPRSRNTGGAATTHLWVVKAAGGQARQVGLDSGGPGYQPAWDTR